MLSRSEVMALPNETFLSVPIMRKITLSKTCFVKGGNRKHEEIETNCRGKLEALFSHANETKFQLKNCVSEKLSDSHRDERHMKS